MKRINSRSSDNPPQESEPETAESAVDVEEAESMATEKNEDEDSRPTPTVVDTTLFKARRELETRGYQTTAAFAEGLTNLGDRDRLLATLRQLRLRPPRLSSPSLAFGS